MSKEAPFSKLYTRSDGTRATIVDMEYLDSIPQAPRGAYEEARDLAYLTSGVDGLLDSQKRSTFYDAFKKGYEDAKHNQVTAWPRVDEDSAISRANWQR